MDDAKRKQIADEAVRKAEIEEALSDPSWFVGRWEETDQTGQVVPVEAGNTFLVRRTPSGKEESRQDIRRFIAELLVERDMWKRRAAQHGCNVVEGDHECG